MCPQLSQNFGTEEDWLYAISEFQTYTSWEQLISSKIGNIHSLNISISNYSLNVENKKWCWLYFIGLKLFGAGDDYYFNNVIAEASSFSEIVHNMYRSILEIEPENNSFKELYYGNSLVLC